MKDKNSIEKRNMNLNIFLRLHFRYRLDFQVILLTVNEKEDFSFTVIITMRWSVRSKKMHSETKNFNCRQNMDLNLLSLMKLFALHRILFDNAYSGQDKNWRDSIRHHHMNGHPEKSCPEWRSVLMAYPIVLLTEKDTKSLVACCKRSHTEVSSKHKNSRGIFLSNISA